MTTTTPLLPEPTLNLPSSFRTAAHHPIKVFRSNVTPSAGMVQQLPCGRVDCEDGCWEGKQLRKGLGVAWALAEGSAMWDVPVEVIEISNAVWERLRLRFKRDGMDSTMGVHFPTTMSGRAGSTLFVVSKWEIRDQPGVTKVTQFEPYTRARMVTIGSNAWSEGNRDFRNVKSLIEEPSDLAQLTVAFSLAQGRIVRAKGRAAHVSGFGKFTANPERRFCEHCEGGSWIWNGQVKLRGRELRICRWCRNPSHTPWRGLKSGSRVKTMTDALKALRPYGAKGREDSTFCYFHILPGWSDSEIERSLVLYGSNLGVSFYPDHSSPNILDLELAAT